MATTGQGPSPNPNSATAKDSLTNQFKVKLRRAASYPYTNMVEGDAGNAGQKRGRINTNSVVFDVTPDITESRNVEYKTMNPIHMPGQIFVYGSTSSRQFQLGSVKLISRTTEEATRNIQTLWTLRGWTMPYFGLGSSTTTDWQKFFRRDMQDNPGFYANDSQALKKLLRGQELLGKPPEVLYLSAYSNAPLMQHNGRGPWTRRFPTNIDNIPVVITSLSIPYPSDVDYIPTEDGQPFPRVMMLDIQLQETRAPREFTEKFSLQKFRQGTLVNF